MVLPYTIENELEGESYGLELAADWLVSKNWKIKASYTYLQIDLDIAV